MFPRDGQFELRADTHGPRREVKQDPARSALLTQNSPHILPIRALTTTTPPGRLIAECELVSKMNKLLSESVALVFLPITLVVRLAKRANKRRETLRILHTPLRLFKHEGDNWRFVWISRNDDGFRIDFGRVGHTSNVQRLPLTDWKTVGGDIDALRAKGYSEFDGEAWEDLIVTYGTETLQESATDTRRMAALSKVLGESLASLGQGFSNGYVIQDGLAHARFLVIDARSAQKCVTSTLSGSDFDDYICVDIFDELPEETLVTPEAA